MSAQQPIRLGLIGAGIFAREAHVPALKKLGDAFEVVAVCSRSGDSAAALAAQLPGPVAVENDIAALLARGDVEAVSIILPINRMPQVVEMALAAGKHIISEKPVAPDVATGRRLLESHARRDGQVWMVAENWRYEAAFVRAAEIVRSGEIGKPLACHWAIHVPMNADNKYYRTAWRRAGTFPGGFILDGGVHHIAVLRLILGEIAGVNAASTLFHVDLAPVDTLSAALQFERGTVGAYVITYATGAPWPPALYIAGESGALRVQLHEIEITGSGGSHTIPFDEVNGVQTELAAFAAAIRQGRPHRNTPEQGLQDVAVIEAMLRSATTGQRVAPERVV